MEEEDLETWQQNERKSFWYNFYQSFVPSKVHRRNCSVQVFLIMFCRQGAPQVLTPKQQS